MSSAELAAAFTASAVRLRARAAVSSPRVAESHIELAEMMERLSAEWRQP